MNQIEMPIRFNEPMEGRVLPTHARMLKELGFDWEIDAYYSTSYNKIASVIKLVWTKKWNHNNYNDLYSAPTIYQAAEWLRKEKGIYVEVIMRRPDRYEVVGKTYDEEAIIQVKHLFDLWDVDAGVFFPTYEIGLLYGIGLALHKLKEKQDESKNKGNR